MTREKSMTKTYLNLRMKLNPVKKLLERAPAIKRVWKSTEVRLLGDRIIPVSCKGGFVVHIFARDEAVGRHLLAAGEWEPDETTLVRELLPVGGTFVDVGANLGYFTALASVVAGPEGRVIAIEPDPQNASLIERTCAVNTFENVMIVREAVGDAPGVLQLSLDSRNLGNHSLTESNVPGSADKKHIPVGVSTLSQIFATAGVERVDVVKIDVQGNEAKALDSVDIRESMDYLLLEFWPVGLSQAGSDAGSFAESLFAAGTVHLVDGHQTPIASPQMLVTGAMNSADGQIDILVKVRSHKQEGMPV